MSDEQALVPVDYTQLPATQMGSDDGFDELAKGGDFLARLQLCSKDKYVIGGMIGPGHWGVPESAEEIVDLGKSIDVVPFARRPKAVDLNDKDAIITNYDMESDEFKRIAAKSMQPNSKCMYGPSFLVYERSSGRFLEWFCGSKSTRSEAKKIYPYLALTAEDIEKRGLNGVEPHGPLPFTMNVKLVEKRDWKWHAPVVTPCSTPFDAIPTSKIVREMERFLNPPVAAVEKVDESEAGTSRAR
jgi:hypothetical protein